MVLIKMSLATDFGPGAGAVAIAVGAMNGGFTLAHSAAVAIGIDLDAGAIPIRITNFAFSAAANQATTQHERAHQSQTKQAFHRVLLT